MRMFIGDGLLMLYDEIRAAWWIRRGCHEIFPAQRPDSPEMLRESAAFYRIRTLSNLAPYEKSHPFQGREGVYHNSSHQSPTNGRVLGGKVSIR